MLRRSAPTWTSGGAAGFAQSERAAVHAGGEEPPQVHQGPLLLLFSFLLPDRSRGAAAYSQVHTGVRFCNTESLVSRQVFNNWLNERVVD